LNSRVPQRSRTRAQSAGSSAHSPRDAARRQRLIIFVKAPRPGTVKTRLGAALGPKAAVQVYVELVEALVTRLASLPNVELRFAPDDAAAEIQPWRKPGWLLVPQGPGGLGRRLERAFGEAFARGARRVVVIGSDCPEVSPEDVELAWTALRRNDVVLGPARDGGYWLVALRRPQPALFRRISWSTERVLRQTLTRCQARRLKVRCLRELEDVDTEADWRAYRRCRLREHRG